MKTQITFLAALAAASLSFQAMADCVAVETSASAAQAPARTAAASAISGTVKNTAVTLHSVALRDRPVAEATGDVVASADTSVRLEHGVRNGDGNWWYVTAAGLGGGWVQTSDLANLPQM